MVKTQELEEIIKSSGLKKKYIANQLGVTVYGLSLKINNIHEFKLSEFVKICDILNITDPQKRSEIFLQQK